MVTKSKRKVYARRKGSLTGPRTPGRPPTYHEGVPVAVFRLALLGATDQEMADVFGVTVETLNSWKTEHPEFSEALTRGKLSADARVAERLFQRALGYSHAAVKIFNVDGEALVVPYTEHYPPDTAAAKHWLNNRRPQNWRDRVEHAGDPTQPVRFIIERIARPDDVVEEDAA